MASAPIDPFAAAQLNEGERRTVARFVARSSERLGHDLRATCLYGSPRGEIESFFIQGIDCG